MGAGFGGLSAALRLSELGARVVLLETLAYPGGCASTFERDGYRFEAGATLFSGLGKGQLFQRWIDRHGLDVQVEWLDPVVELRSPTHRLSVGRQRNDLVQHMAHLADVEGVPRAAVTRFFERQGEVADILWGWLDEPELLPPFRCQSLGKHLLRALDYARLAPFVGKSLASVLDRYGLSRFEPLRLHLDALCRITVQCSLQEAEALLAMGAMDYYFRGTGHVGGGIGRLASGLVDAIRRLGGSVSMPNAVSSLERTSSGWRVATRRGEILAPRVVANLLPQTLQTLTNRDLSSFASDLSRRVEDGFGAAVLYRIVRAPEPSRESPQHLALVADPSAPLVEGNHVFCSFSGASETDRAPAGYRTGTFSTHVLATGVEDPAAYLQRVHERMRETLRTLAPEWETDVAHELTASPRTFERFTNRYRGFVGGAPKRVGLHNYRYLEPRPALDGLYLVGDAIFPGQSTLAAAIGGWKLAGHLAA